MAMQGVRTTVFDIPWTGSHPALLPAYAGRPRVLVVGDDEELRVLVDKLAPERQRRVRARPQVTRPLARRRPGR
jgi:hypothetical protein